MGTRTMKRVAGIALATGLLLGGAQLSAATAMADVLPENASDVGVYTDGTTDSMSIGDPVYTNAAEVAGKLDPGVPYTAGSMHQSIFDKDKAAGGTDYYLDRVLGVKGTIGTTILQTRGRSLYMRGTSTASFTTMGFAGTAYAGGPNSLGNFYTITVPNQTVTEQSANRFNAPSHMSDSYTIGTTGVTADEKKLITYDNVAVTTLTFKNPGTAAVTFTVRAASPIATGSTTATDELIGTKTLTSGSNNGLIDTAWSKVTIGLKASGFTVNGTNLERSVTVPAGGDLSLSVVGVLYSDSLPESKSSFYDYAAMAPADAFREGVTDFNQRWASDIPYIDVPDPGVEKAIIYRWWGERYNSLDANEPGYVYQYPTTIEGVNLYQNAVVLTQPMHLQDTKWIRNPYLAYGQILNVGELSGSSAFLDSPGHTSWNNHYSQYIGTAGLEAYEVHGGGPQVAQRFAEYFEGDGVGQLEHYDGNGNNLIAYDTYYMPGNDADAISFGYPKSNTGAAGSRTIERPESAYVYGDFLAASQLYAMAGAGSDKVDAMNAKASAVQSAVLDKLWSPTMRMFLTGTSYGASSAATANGKANPLPAAERSLIPARESNLYDIYAENLIPDSQASTYVDGLRFLRYGDNFPIFPFYTANQYDRTAYAIGGSNNFSNINFTVQYRAVREALRHYDTSGKYITPEYARKLLDWMAWSVYPGGDMRIPNQGEYYSGWNATTKSFTRNNPYHVMLGNMNYIYIEDMGGLQTRSDDKIELSPIDLGYDHFMVNNLSYHGKDLTITWDPDGTVYGLGSGYSLFIDGQRVASKDTLTAFTYDPAANTATNGAQVHVGTAPTVPTAVATQITDDRVVDYLKTAGIDLTEDAPNLATGATLSSSYTQQGTRPTPWRDFHTPGSSTSAMNYTPGAIKTDERPVSLAAVTDGNTVNEPYWGNYGTTEAAGYVELDFDGPKSFDNVKTYFVSDRQAGGYAEPQKWSVQVRNDAGQWVSVPSQAKIPKVPTAKFNEALFPTRTADAIRIAFTNKSGLYTAISEIQVFDSGREVPVVVNEPPVVTATADRTRDGNLSSNLAATVTDDGLPDDGTLTYGWSVVSTPAGGSVIFGTPKALTTSVTGTVAGSYTVRFTASDGELSTSRDVTLDLTAKQVVAEFGASATISTSGSASWEDPNKVNLATTPTSSNPGAGNGWGTWGQANNGTSTATAAWIKYSWAAPVLLTSTDLYWYDDGGGTRRPTGTTYAVEYTTDGTTWTPVTLTGGSTYAGALNTNAYNHLNFAPIQAKELRIRIWGVQTGGAGTGVLRWRANGDTVSTVASPVIMRTQTGTVPTLPASLDVVYSGGTRGTAAFTWQPITADMVAETNVEPFVVYGTNSAYGLIAEAQIYVRPEMSEGGISIQGAQSFTQKVDVGQQPVLPTKVEVSYNDGSKDNQAIGVDWDFDPAIVQTEGHYTITGDLVLPWYVSSAGTVQTTLKLTVGNPPEPGITSVTVSPKTAVVVKGTTKQFTADVVAVGGASAAVVWSVSGGATGTAVSDDGLLTVGTGETATSLTVKATSVVDPSKSDSATVTITAPVTTTSVAGRVTGASGAPVPGACVYLYPHGVSTAAIAASCGSADGRYVVRSVPSGSYDVAVVDPSGGYPTQWYAGTDATVTQQDDATAVVVGSAALTGLDVTLKAATSGVISGLVTDATSGENLANVCAFVYRADEQSSAGYATCTSTDGGYWIGSVATGSYQVAFFDPTGAHPTAWFAGPGTSPAAGRNDATMVTVTGGATSTVSVALAGRTTGVVTGTITAAADSAPLAEVCAYLYPHGQSAAAVYATCTGADGSYWFGQVSTGSYDLAVYDPTGAHPTGWYAGAGAAPAAAQSGATALVVAGGATVTADLAMAGRTGASVSGAVTATGGSPLANICVFAYQHGQSAAASFASCSVADGTYQLPQVTSGSYDVAFYDPSGGYLTQWWTGTAAGSPTQSGASPVAVATTPVAGVNALMAAVA